MNLFVGIIRDIGIFLSKKNCRKKVKMTNVTRRIVAVS